MDAGASYRYLFKFIIIGDMAVGKSCLNLQFLEGQSRETHDITIGVEFGAKTVRVGSTNIKLQIWDTAGQENFRSLTRSYYKSAVGAVVVYDITRETFKSLAGWLDEVQQNCNPSLRTVLIGNKSDLEDSRQVSAEEGKRFAKANNMIFLEASAREAKNVQEAFMSLTSEILNDVEKGTIEISNEFGGVKLGNEKFDPTTPRNDQPKNTGCEC